MAAVDYDDLLFVVDYLGAPVTKEYFDYAMSQGIKLTIKPDHAVVEDRPKNLGVDYQRPKRKRPKRRRDTSPLADRSSGFC